MPLVASPVNGFWKRSRRVQAERLCLSVLSQARMPIFYEKWGVPDTLEGRFDCACLHMAILLKYLKGPLAQAVFDAFFTYTELTLREVGVSDLRVGKQVKQCAKFFYGALKSYKNASEGKESLEEALMRNLYGQPSLHANAVATYIRACDQHLRGQDFERATALLWPSIDEKVSETCHP